jgi:cytochrome c553
MPGRTLLLVVLAVALAPAANASQTSERAQARSLAATCSNCHGAPFVGEGAVRALRGMSRADIVQALTEFKSGTRAGTIMPQLAKGYTDAQIASIAEWYAMQKP